MSGLVSDKKHGYEHSDRAAECREQKQSRLFGAVLGIVLGRDLVVNANYYRDKRDSRQISQKYL